MLKNRFEGEEKKQRKWYILNLFLFWNNVDDLFAPKVSVARNQPSNVPVSDWNKVNSRFIANIPAPSPQPLHGSSEDPEFYQHKNVQRCQPRGTVACPER